MREPKISVVIPVYNSFADLGKCLDSVLNQTYKNLEIILIDDGSNDGSGALCDEYAGKDTRIVCLHQENKGVSATRNRGIQIGSGDYYHFLDSDDYIELDAYEHMVRLLQENHAQGVSFEYYITHTDREEVHSLSEDAYGIRDTAGAIHGHLFEGNTFLCTKLLPSYAVKKLRFREDIYRDEDTLFGWQALRMIPVVFFTQRPMLHYVQSAESATRGRFRKNQLSATKVIPIMEQFLASEYPQWLNQWRSIYMHLMIMLYMDMALDEDDYSEEQRMIYDTFVSLYKKVSFRNIGGVKNRVKFLLFKSSPSIFTRFHKLIHRL